MERDALQLSHLRVYRLTLLVAHSSPSALRRMDCTIHV